MNYQLKYKKPRDEGGFIARIYMGWCVGLYAIS